MNVDRLVEEYARSKELEKGLTKRLGDLKNLLVKALERDGDQDDKGHRWLPAGKFMLKHERRQGKPYLDKEKAKEFAIANGLWHEDAVKKVTVIEEVDEDALLKFFWQNKDRESELKELYTTPEPTYAVTYSETTHYDY